MRRLPTLDVLAQLVRQARHSDGLQTYARALAQEARNGRSLTASEAVIVDEARAWFEEPQ